MPPVSTTMKLAAAGGVAAVVAGIGATQALADTTTPSPSTSGSSPTAIEAPSRTGRGPGGPGGHRGGGGVDAAALASKLGLTEAKVQAALDAVRGSLKPTTPPAQGTTPTEAARAARAAREKARDAALAKALGVTEAKVQAAFDALKAERAAARKSELTTRLDAAVEAGTLTAADKASVLKAFDAGVLGGGRG